MEMLFLCIARASTTSLADNAHSTERTQTKHHSLMSFRPTSRALKASLHSPRLCYPRIPLTTQWKLSGPGLEYHGHRALSQSPSFRPSKGTQGMLSCLREMIFCVGTACLQRCEFVFEDACNILRSRKIRRCHISRVPVEPYAY